MRNELFKIKKDSEVPIMELYELRKAAFQQWTDFGLFTLVPEMSLEQFKRTLKNKMIVVAQDGATGELLAMRTLTLNKEKGCALENDLSVSPKVKRQGIGTRLIEAEVRWLQKEGYRYTTCLTGIPATWSVRWHLKNGYYIVGYSRSEKRNYPIYIFRKQLAVDVRHHPTDLLWTKPIVPLTAKLRYCLSWLATNICKSKSGKLNAIGRIAKDVRSKMNSHCNATLSKRERHTLT